MNTVKQSIKYWGYLLPYTLVPSNAAEHEKLVCFAEELMRISRHKKDDRVTSLLRLIAKNIEVYEMQHYKTKPVAQSTGLKKIIMKLIYLTTFLITFIITYTFINSAYAYHIGDKVELGTTESCSACQEAKEILNKHHIRYTEVTPSYRYSYYVPQLFVNGKYKGTGVNVVEDYANE